MYHVPADAMRHTASASPEAQAKRKDAMGIKCEVSWWIWELRL